VINVARLPISWTSSTASQVPALLMATGYKMCVHGGEFIILGDFVGCCLVRRCSYLCGSVANVCMHYMSGTVTSQAIGLPLDHGINVLQSGRLLL